MKLTFATAILVGSTAAFTAPALVNRHSALAMGASATETPVYTFAKSEEIFAEAKNVRKLRPFIVFLTTQLSLHTPSLFP
jgi:hypothetical protein